MKIKIFSDGASIDAMVKDYESGFVSGFTTNPTLMRAAGVTSYIDFAKEALDRLGDVPISFEVFADDLREMYVQGKKLGLLGDNVYIKIPVTNTKGESTGQTIRYLSTDGFNVNVTAVMTCSQTIEICNALEGGAKSVVSIFAGRIADSGVDPVPVMKRCLSETRMLVNCELLWASVREVYNIYQAEEVGCNIVTATPSILKKLKLRGKNLDKYSLETVKMFYDDAKEAGFSL
ncbi:transaldolase [bacterium]|nr:transaldolase [bacterium]|tara:strand:+ start:93 stop:791 length:699 start_codon:yes stop_codon:yes gene_type:complete